MRVKDIATGMMVWAIGLVGLTLLMGGKSDSIGTLEILLFFGGLTFIPALVVSVIFSLIKTAYDRASSVDQ